jgi:hypothetical protein
VLALLVWAASASASTVTTTEDGGPGSLRQLIAEAPRGETINVPAGTYVLNQGVLEVDDALTIAGAGAGTTTISGAGEQRIFVVETGKRTANVTLSGLTLTEAKSSGEDAVFGSAVLARGGKLTLTLRDDVVSQNETVLTGEERFRFGLGGAVFFSGASIDVESTKIVGNTLVGNGDGFRLAGGILEGGGIATVTTGLLTVRNSAVEGNLAEAAAGPKAPEGGTVFGAGANLIAFGPALIADSTFAGNVGDVRGGESAPDGDSEGGGLFFVSGGKNEIARVTIADNVLRAGAGFAAGGGLFVDEQGGAEVTASTIASNSVEGGPRSFGGNVGTRGPVRFAGTIVANGIGPAGAQNCGVATREENEGENPSLSSEGFNLDSADQCGFHVPGDVVGRNPQLGPLSDNGGPTKTLLPATGSPVIDQGSSRRMTVDQRGLRRPVDLAGVPNATADGADGADIGSAEVQETSPRRR